ncbi:MAG: MFS transporter [Gemmatimonadaceae bacterium]
MTNRWAVLAIVIVVTTIGMMSFAAPFALLPVWIRELGLTKAKAGLLSGLWYLPGIAVALPAGWLVDRYPARRVMLVLWTLIVLGMGGMSLATSFLALCVGRFLFSVGMNAHMVGAPKILGNWFAGRREFGFVMGLYTLAFTAGVFLSLNVLGRIGETRGSMPALQLLAALSLVGLGLLALVPGAPNDAPAEDRSATTSAAAATTTSFRPWALGAGAWMLAIAYFGYSIGTEAYLTFTPDLLVGRGLALRLASSTTGAYALIAFILKPLLSALLTRERAPWFTAGATLAALMSVALLFVGVPPLVSAAMMGISLALGMPSLMALPNYLLPPTKSGQAYGLYQLLYSLGFFAQPLVGATVDRTGSYGAGFVVIALYTAIGFGVLLPIVRRMRGSAVPSPSASSA